MEALRDKNENKSSYLTDGVNLILTWKATTKTFESYNKETKEKGSFDKINFYRLWHGKAIRGYSTADSSIRSNVVEMYNGDEVITCYDDVKSFKLTGSYKNISDQVAAVGGKFCKVIYIYLLETKSLAALELTGSAMAAYIDFEEKFKNEEDNNQICFLGKVEEKKKGANKYNEPVFEVGPSIDAEAKQTERKAYTQLMSTLEPYLADNKNRHSKNSVASNQSSSSLPVLILDSIKYDKIVEKIKNKTLLSLDTVKEHFTLYSDVEAELNKLLTPSASKDPLGLEDDNDLPF